jgi:C4-dicarboxylate-specific signal transduction histidine kinase
MTHEELDEAVPLYVVGALERAERQALDAHFLSGCAPCHTALKEYQSVAVTLPFGLPLVPPPRGLKARIMSARTADPSPQSTAQPLAKPSLEPGEWMNHLFPPSSPPARSFGWALGMVILAIVAMLSVLSVIFSPQGTNDAGRIAELQTQADALNTRLTALQQQLSEREESLAKTQEELQRRTAELAEVKDQLIQREAELDGLKANLAQPRGRSGRIP